MREPSDFDRLQAVINAAARLTSDSCRYDHVTPLLNDLHWLRFPERITYKLCILVQPTTVFMARRRGIHKMSFSLLLK